MTHLDLRPSSGPGRQARLPALLAGLAVLALAGCGGASGGGLAGASGASGSSASAGSTQASPASAPAGITVTVPELGGPAAAPPSSVEPSPAPVPESSAEAAGEPGEASPPPVEATDTAAESPAESLAESPSEPSAESPASAPAEQTPPPAAQPAPVPAPAGDGATVPVTLANCPGCSVLATHAAVTGDLSAALVASGTGRALLLSVGPDGEVRGLINIPYGAEFPAPEGGVLPCDAQARCVVSARQSDGRAILSAFELTGTGAWRDVSGNDAFPSANGEGRTVDLDGALGIAVQDAAADAAVWMVFGWSGDRYTVVGCSTDTAADPSQVALDPAACLS